ncbi:Scp2 (predicted) [Pycnogonum litorale]
MGNTQLMAINRGKPQLSSFQKRKLMFEYHIFFDKNKDGVLTEKDVHLARKEICDMNKWLPGSVKYDSTKELFDGIWKELTRSADENSDNKITGEEWIAMWQTFHEAVQENREEKFPDWVKAYLLYRFQLLDRNQDGVIDEEEFIYVMDKLGISSKTAKTAYMMFTMNYAKKVNYDYFRKMAAQYYRSDDPSSLGNFITGKLDWFD